MIPYEKIVSEDSLDLTPENSMFFEKRELYSELKQNFVSDEEYENSFYLYKTLKMRNLSDMNGLHNAQDVILLCEIIENCFQVMYDKYGFNSRKRNSPSAISRCIKREVIIALPASNEAVEVFGKNINWRF